MVIKNFFVCILLIWLPSVVLATGVSCESRFAKPHPTRSPPQMKEKPYWSLVMPGSWTLKSVIEKPSPNPLGKHAYPESIVIRQTPPHEIFTLGQIEIQFSSKDNPVGYDFVLSGGKNPNSGRPIKNSIMDITRTTDSEVPNQAHDRLMTHSYTFFNHKEHEITIKLEFWEKQRENLNVIKKVGSASYTFTVDGETLLFTRTIDDLSEKQSPTVYKATYTRQQ